MTSEELQAKYPDLLSECFDFSPPNGWLKLVSNLLWEIQNDIDYTSERLKIGLGAVDKYPAWADEIPILQAKIKNFEDNPVKVVQVKTKFSGLRFYVHNATEEMTHWIRFAEHLSHTMCEGCGIPTEDSAPRSGMHVCSSCESRITSERNFKYQ